MRKLLVMIVLAAAVLSGVWLVLGGPAAREAEAPAGAQRAAVTQVEAKRGAGQDASARGFGSGEAREQKIRAQAAERAVMHQRITEQLARRAAAKKNGAAEPEAAHEQAAKVEAAEEDVVVDRLQVVDQTGERGYLMKVMNEELMPLADECVQMAQERRPELAGLLAVDVNLVGDEDVGGVVEEVAASGLSELKDAELIECVRESMLAVTLPPPPQGGRDAFMLSIPVEPAK